MPEVVIQFDPVFECYYLLLVEREGKTIHGEVWIEFSKIDELIKKLQEMKQNHEQGL
jgi:hypothetical protein